MAFDEQKLQSYAAQPNQFITAEAWNALRDGMLEVYQCIVQFSRAPGFLIVAMVDAVDLQPVSSDLIEEIVVIRMGTTTPMGTLHVIDDVYVIADLEPGEYTITASLNSESEFLDPVPRDVCVLSRRGTEVTVSLSKPPPERVPIPDLFDKSLQEALNILISAELTPGDVINSHGINVELIEMGGNLIPISDFGQDLVLSSEPGAERVVEKGSAVHILISAERQAE